MMKRVSLIVACVALLALAASASAKGIPSQSMSRQVPGVPCSATATFTPDTGKGLMSYKGGVSCAGGIGQKTLDVVPQVRKISKGKVRWFSISLAGLYQGPTPVNPVRLRGTRPAVKGHVYRLLVYGQVISPDGRVSHTTACVGSGCAGSPTLSIQPTSTYVSQTGQTVRLAEVPCWVGYHELIFTVVNRSLVMSYGGHTTCVTADGRRSLTVCAQVVNRIHGKDVWFTIDGSCLKQTATASSYVELVTARTAYTAHNYRVLVSATITYPTANGTITRTRTLHSPLGAA